MNSSLHPSRQSHEPATTRKPLRWLAVVGVLAVLPLAGLTAADPAPRTLHDLMKNVVAVQADVIWSVDPTDKHGKPDATKVKPADWQRIAAAAGKIRQATKTLVNAEQLVVAKPGQKLDGEGIGGAWTAMDVDHAIKTNPAAFRAFVQTMSTSMDNISAAASARSADKLADEAGKLDEYCEQCHKQFWYPNQRQ